MTGKLKSRSHMVDFLFALALFCVFAATALLVVLIGARVYKTTVDNMNINFERRTSLSYVSTKIRQFDSYGAVSIDDLDGIPVLAMRQSIDDSKYLTMVYYYEGALRERSVNELLISEGGKISANDGTIIMYLQDFRMYEVEPGVFNFTSVDKNGALSELIVCLQSKQRQTQNIRR